MDEQLRNDKINDAEQEVKEDGYIIAFNVGYDDYPVWDNPFSHGSKQHRGYRAGYDCRRSQLLYPED